MMFCLPIGNERQDALAVVAGAARWAVAQEEECLDLLRALPDACAEVIATDPPYARTGGESSWVSRQKVRSLPRETQFYEAWIREHLVEFRRLLKPSGGIWIACDWTAAIAIDRACYKADLRAPVIGVWHREGLGMGSVLRHVYECFAVITMPKFKRISTNEPDLWTHKWTPGNRKTGHSAENPVPLMARAIRLLGRPGGLVLDPFSGSGSTGVAALQAGMRYVGVERHGAFVELQRGRLAAEPTGAR